MSTTARVSRGLAAALMAGGALFLAAPGAQAAEGTQIIPCGQYVISGIAYWGNCGSSSTVISVTQPGLEGWTVCVGAGDATTLGDAIANWIVRNLNRSC